MTMTRFTHMCWVIQFILGSRSQLNSVVDTMVVYVTSMWCYIIWHLGCEWSGDKKYYSSFINLFVHVIKIIDKFGSGFTYISHLHVLKYDQEKKKKHRNWQRHFYHIWSDKEKPPEISRITVINSKYTPLEKTESTLANANRMKITNGGNPRKTDHKAPPSPLPNNNNNNNNNNKK